MLARYFLRPFLIAHLLFCAPPLFASCLDEFKETGILKGQKIDSLKFDPYLRYLEEKAPPLKALDLSDNLLDAAGAVSLQYLLELDLPFESLNLEQNHLNNQALGYLAQGLQENHHLKYLNLRGNPFSLSPDAFKKEIGLRAKEIEILFDETSQKNGPSLFIGLKSEETSLAKDLKEALSSESLKGWGLDSSKFDACLQMLEKEKIVLQNLNLSKNQLDASGAISVQVLLGEMPSLEALNLSKNRLDDQALLYIGEGLDVHQTLKTLDLSENSLTAKGLPFLFKSSSLTSLDLSGHALGDEGLKTLAEILSKGKAPSLTTLKVLEWGVTKEGVGDFKKTLGDDFKGKLIWQLEEEQVESAPPQISEPEKFSNNPYAQELKALEKALDAGQIEAVQKLINLFESAKTDLQNYLSEDDIYKLHDQAGQILGNYQKMEASNIKLESIELPTNDAFDRAIDGVFQ